MRQCDQFHLTHHRPSDITGDVRVVLDTNVIVAAMRSPTGASAALLIAARRGEVTLVSNVALALEYEATCCPPEHGLAAGLNPAQVSIFLDAVIAMVEPVETHFLWRPLLHDPGDEPILES
ncbi:MAG: PIN domain-containing protein [Accumulibacter sp.]|uniref:PIN domain-containing protein n=1 Tax=Accumulibacter sp. TaxID=2053492 RepID=UPI00331633FC